MQLHPITGGPNPMASAERLAECLASGLDRIGGLIAEVLAEGGLTPAQVGTVFLTGGSSDLPALRALVGRVLPGVPVATGDMLGSVGAGLALEARRRFA
jgi:hypothetical chaperone protein